MFREIRSVEKVVLITMILSLFTGSMIFGQIYITSDFITVNTVQKGDTYTGEVSVMNVGDRVERVRLSQNDYLFYANGQDVYPEAGYLERSNSSWIQFSLDDFSVNPGEERTVSYIVRVPSEKELIGSYWSTIMVQAITDTALNEENEGTAKVNTALRFALQVVTEIGDTGIATVEFQNPKHKASDGECCFSVDIENTGEKHFKLFSSAIVYSSVGSYIGTFPGTRKICYPGSSVKLTVDLPELEKGSYQIQFIADGGENDIFGALYGLEI